MDILDSSALEQLFRAHPPRDSFGPGSERPYLAIDLADGDTDLARCLSGLPCPTIGIGTGPLASSCDILLPDAREMPLLARNITKAPITAMILVQHLRASETLSLQDALIAESFAYAAVQQGTEFQQWKAASERPADALEAPDRPLLVEANDDALLLQLNDPENHNAIGTVMRDALCDALDLALTDDAIARVKITALGRCFSVGGAVEEFGEVSDPATAHLIRSLRLPAWRLARLADRLEIHVQGAAIGAGAEIAAFAQRLSASEDAWFQLPELKYGLIPGAGGTASITRRIGRQRTAYMALSMARVRAGTALEWGLIDEITR